YRAKYRNEKIDLVVAFGSKALDLMLQLQPRLWPNVPMVFSVVDEPTLAGRTLPPNVTGLTWRGTIRDQVALARPILPGLAHVVVVGDAPERQFVRNRVREDMTALAGEIDVIDLTALRMGELKQRVRALPPASAIIYIGLTSDADGVVYTSYDA